MLWQSFHFSKLHKCGFSLHTIVVLGAKFLLEIFFQKFRLLVVGFTQSILPLSAESN